MENIQMKLLVVEDDESSRRIVRRQLESFGYNVDESADGEEAIGMMALKIYDLAIIDLMMPVMSGVELIGHMREIPALKHTAIVVVSSHQDPFGEVMGKLKRCQVLRKPVERKDFEEAILMARGMS